MAINSLPNPKPEFCTECSDFVDSLDERTGWCAKCSKNLGYFTPVCPRCNQPSLRGLQCGRCKYEIWLERNADEIEHIMVTCIVSVRVAKRMVQAKNRPICHSCHEPIKGGQKGRHFFCTKKPECVKAHNAYRSGIRRNKPHSEALELAITASLIYKLTANITIKDKPHEGHRS